VKKTATSALQTLKVDIKLQTRVTSSTRLANGREELTLSSGDKLTTDMYIPTFGVDPNSSYMPAPFLNANGFVMVDDFLQVKGAHDVWAIGDVSDVEPPQFIYCDRQSAYLSKNIISLLSGKTPLPYKVAASSKISVFFPELKTMLTIDRIYGTLDRKESWNGTLWKLSDSYIRH
jgi:NADH dehydrogenase FAD-containing subunit